MLQRATLLAGEHRRVELLAQLLDRKDEAAAGTAECLVRRRGDDVRVRNRRGVQTRSDQTGEVRHVDHQIGADFVGDAPELGEVELTRVGRPAGEDQFRLAFTSEPPNLVHVDPVVVFPYVIRGDVVEPAGEVQLHAVGQVPTVGQ